MKGWKLGAAALAICTGISGGAWAQSSAATPQASQTKAAIVQTALQDRDHDRDDNGRWNNDRRDRDHDRDRDRDHRAYQRDRDHDRDGRWRNNNGWYGRRGDDDRGNRGAYSYGNGPYRAYPNGGYYGYGQPGYGYGRGGYGYGNNAGMQMGYQDGFNYGQYDASHGKAYRPTGSEAYEDANHGYNSSFGDRNTFKQEYRQGYQQGYQEGYNGGGYGGRR